MSALVLLGVVASSALAAFPTGGFLAVMNEQRNNSDSPLSVSFYDVDDLNTPLFAVFVGQEFCAGASCIGWEETQGMTVDPATGDIYFNAFDSPSGGPGIDPFGDTIGDMDLFRIPFSTVYQHWSSNFEGEDVRTLANPIGWGPAPGWIGDGSIQNVGNPDYVTYSVRDDFVDNGFTVGHSNTFVLPGVVEKIGEVTRGDGGDEDDTDGMTGPFWLDALEFISETEILLLGDSLSAHAPVANQDPADDHSFRMFRRVAQTNGSASTSAGTLPSTTAYLDGGYNGGDGATNSFGKPTESWESELIAFVGLDDPEAGGHSEPESLAYANRDGVRGVWVSERDMPASGDQLAFMEIDSGGNAVGYRFIQVDPENVFGTIIMSNNPADPEDAGVLLGQVENIFVDSDTGDLIVIESGFADDENYIGGVETEPAVIRLRIDSYAGGEFNDLIVVDGWDEKIFLDPVKDPADTFVARGQWSAYDSENDIVYFFSPGHDTDNVVFGVDIYALDLTTGMTTTYSNVDESYSLFLNDSYGDKVAFFSLAAPDGLIGDYNGDNVVDAADYTVWRDAQENGDMDLLNRDPLNSGLVDEDDYASWRENFGSFLAASGSVSGPLSSVPEPSSLALLVMGLAGGLAVVRRRRR